MKLNGRTVRNHLVPEPQFVFVQPVSSEQRNIAVTNCFDRWIRHGLPGNGVSEQVIGKITEVLLT